MCTESACDLSFHAVCGPTWDDQVYPALTGLELGVLSVPTGVPWTSYVLVMQHGSRQYGQVPHSAAEQRRTPFSTCSAL